MGNSKNIMLGGICFALVLLAHAQAPDTLWTRTYGASNSDECFEMCSADDSGFVLVGFTNSYGGGDWDYYLLRVDDVGDTIWTQTYGEYTDEYGHCMCVSADGGFMIGGVRHSGDYDICMLKTDSLGNELWLTLYGGTMNDMADGVCQSTDGGYVVTGAVDVNNTMTSGNLLLLKLSENGDTVWTKRYGGSAYDFGSAIRPTIDGGYIVCGLTRSFGSGGSDVWLLRTDAEGDTLWTKTCGGSADDEAWAVQQTADGGYVLVGFTGSYGAGSWDVYVIKTDSAGAEMWTQTYGGSQYDIGMGIAQTSDNGYVVTGTYDGQSEWVGGDLLLLKLNAAGNTEWTSSVGGNEEDWGYSVCQTGDGGYVIGGKTASFGAGNYDVYLVKYGPEPGIEEYRGYAPDNDSPGATIINGAITLPVGVCFRIFDINGRAVAPDRIQPGIYFIEIDGKISQKVVKVR